MASIFSFPAETILRNVAAPVLNLDVSNKAYTDANDILTLTTAKLYTDTANTYLQSLIANTGGGGSANAAGPAGSIQISDGSGGLTNSSSLLWNESSQSLNVSSISSITAFGDFVIKGANGNNDNEDDYYGGGSINIEAGDVWANTLADGAGGGQINISGGNGNPAFNSSGGSVLIEGGNAYGSENAGEVRIEGGTAFGSGSPGALTISSGSTTTGNGVITTIAGGSTDNGTAGDVTIFPGSAVSSGFGGNLNLYGGWSNDGPQAYGNVELGLFQTKAVNVRSPFNISANGITFADGTTQYTANAGGGSGNTVALAYTQFTPTVNGINQIFTNDNLTYFTNGDYAIVFKNGVALSPSDYTISGNTLTISSYLVTSDAIDVAPTSSGGTATGGGVSNTQLNQANTWLQANDSITLQASIAYTDQAVANVSANTDSSNAYALSLVETANTFLQANDSLTLSVAQAYTDATNTWIQANISGGNTTPGGPSGAIQFNDNGVLGGNASFYYSVGALGAKVEVPELTAQTLRVAGNPISGRIGEFEIDFCNVIFTQSSTQLGDVSSIHIDGGSNNQVLSTDGSGNLSWVTQSGGGNTTPGGIDGSIQFNNNGVLDGNTNFTYDFITGKLDVFQIDISNELNVDSGFITLLDGDLVIQGSNARFVESNTHLGDIANVHITGGSSNQVLSTDGSGNLSWVTQSGGGNTSGLVLESPIYTGLQVSSVGPTDTFVVQGNASVSLPVGAEITFEGTNDTWTITSSVFGSITTEITVTPNWVDSDYTPFYLNRILKAFATDPSISKIAAGDGITIDYSSFGNTATFQVSSSASDNELLFSQNGLFFGVTGVTSDGSSISMSNTGIKITGGANGQVLSTDGAGNLSWSNTSTTTYANGSIGAIQFAGANGEFDSSSNLYFTGTQFAAVGDILLGRQGVANGSYILSNEITGITVGRFGRSSLNIDDKGINLSSQDGVTFNSLSGAVVTLPNVSLVKMAGGANNQVLSTDGAGNLSWVNQSNNITSPITYSQLSSLPLTAGSRSFISDASALGTWGTVVSSGGGSTVIPVWCDGTDWRIG